MNMRDAFSERMVFGTFAFAIYGAFGGMVLSGFSASKGVTDSVVGFIVGAAATSLTQVVQSSFRTDRTDEKRADTAQTAVTALAAAAPVATGTTTTVTTATTSDPAPPVDPAAAAIEVVGLGGGPVQTEEAPPGSERTP